MSQMFFNPIDGNLVSHSVDNGLLTKFSLHGDKWEGDIHQPNIPPSSYNHSLAYNSADSSMWLFGGYGLHHFNNNLYRIDLRNGGSIEQVKYHGTPISPRTNVASAIVGDKLYLFGGFGNESGMQALPCGSACDMYEIDLNTLEVKKLWELEAQKHIVMAPTMYFNEADSSFYALSTHRGGEMWKISLNEPKIERIGKNIGGDDNYSDISLSLSLSPDGKRMYAAINRVMYDGTHHINIYYISLPVIPESEILQATPGSSVMRTLWIIIALVLILLLLSATYLLLRRNGYNIFSCCKRSATPTMPTAKPNPADGGNDGNNAYNAYNADVPNVVADASDIENDASQAHELPTTSVIQLLGTFRIINNEGVDIASKLAPRMRDLFLLSYLYTIHNGHGASHERIAEIIWPDKDEYLTRKNRNVTLTRLRPVLREIGSFDIKNGDEYVRLSFGDDVFCDYLQLKKDLKAYEQGDDSKINEIVKLLGRGPLLPFVKKEWLDPFKEEFSIQVIEILTRMLQKEVEKENWQRVFTLTNSILSHESLNEEAIVAKCIALIKTDHTQSAREVYDKFRYDYHHDMGMDFNVSFKYILEKALGKQQ